MDICRYLGASVEGSTVATNAAANDDNIIVVLHRERGDIALGAQRAHPASRPREAERGRKGEEGERGEQERGRERERERKRGERGVKLRGFRIRVIDAIVEAILHFSSSHSFFFFLLLVVLSCTFSLPSLQSDDTSTFSTTSSQHMVV